MDGGGRRDEGSNTHVRMRKLWCDRYEVLFPTLFFFGSSRSWLVRHSLDLAGVEVCRPS